MRARPPILLVAVLLLAGALAWWATRPRDVAPAPAEGVEAAPADVAAPLLAAKDAEAAEGYRVEDGVAVPRDRVSEEPGKGVVVVRLVDGEGRPVGGRTVHGSLNGFTGRGPRGEVLATSRFVRLPLRSRRSDGSGVVRWAGLTEGLGVDAYVPGDERWTPAYDHIAVGAPLRTVRLSPLTPVSVRVTDPDGRAVPGALVLLCGPPAGPEARFRVLRWGRGALRPSDETVTSDARTDAAGVARFGVPEALRDGGRLWVSAEGFAPWVDLAWPARDTEVRLEPAKDLEGVVRDAAGGLVADGVVHWQTSNGLQGWVRVEYDGTFVVPDLAPAGARLEWRLPDAPWLDGRNVQHAAPGDGTVTLQVSTGVEVAIRIEGWPRQGGGEAFLTPQDDPRPDAPRLAAEIDPDGTARFQGLEPARPYVLWVPPRPSPSYGPREPEMDGIVYRRDVVAATEPVVVRLEAGRTVRGVVDLAGTDAPDAAPRGPPRPTVSIRGLGMRLDRTVRVSRPGDREVAFEASGVPEGDFVVVVDLRIDRAGDEPASIWTGEAPVPAGEAPVRVPLRRASEPPVR